jgi:hypothetical protein
VTHRPHAGRTDSSSVRMRYAQFVISPEPLLRCRRCQSASASDESTDAISCWALRVYVSSSVRDCSSGSFMRVPLQVQGAQFRGVLAFRWRTCCDSIVARHVWSSAMSGRLDKRARPGTSAGIVCERPPATGAQHARRSVHRTLDVRMRVADASRGARRTEAAAVQRPP